nr:hypothetical protein [Azospirillum argentinense]
MPVPTVQGWLRRGRIPAAKQALVLARGTVLDPPLTPGDFFDAGAPVE